MTAVASVLTDHVAFQLDSVDRLFIAGYVPELQHEGGLVRFLIDRGYSIPSPAGLGHNHDRLVSEIEAFVAEGAIPLVRFGKGESKEEVARPYLAEAAQQGREGVVLVGKAQERVAGWRGFKDRSSALHPSPVLPSGGPPASRRLSVGPVIRLASSRPRIGRGRCGPSPVPVPTLRPSHLPYPGGSSAPASPADQVPGEALLGPRRSNSAGNASIAACNPSETRFADKFIGTQSPRRA